MDTVVFLAESMESVCHLTLDWQRNGAEIVDEHGFTRVFDGCMSQRSFARIASEFDVCWALRSLTLCGESSDDFALPPGETLESLAICVARALDATSLEMYAGLRCPSLKRLRLAAWNRPELLPSTAVETLVLELLGPARKLAELQLDSVRLQRPSDETSAPPLKLLVDNIVETQLFFQDVELCG